jgi:cobaltochelatase CobN
MQGAGLDPIIRLTRALLREGLAPMPVFVTSLKDPVSRATLAALFAQAPPAVILNCTAFATGSPHQGEVGEQNPLAGRAGQPRAGAAGGALGRHAGRVGGGDRGLSARDIAMNVALPEVDGRIITRAISFKGEAAYRDAQTQCSIVTYRALADRVTFVARKRRAGRDCGQRPRQTARWRSCWPITPTRTGGWPMVWALTPPQATHAALHLLAGSGLYAGTAARQRRGPDGPADGRPDQLADRPRRPQGGEHLPLATYRQHFGALPWAAKKRSPTAGASPSRPFHRCPNTPAGGSAG